MVLVIMQVVETNVDPRSPVLKGEEFTFALLFLSGKKIQIGLLTTAEHDFPTVGKLKFN